jgi:hypothetical protein
MRAQNKNEPRATNTQSVNYQKRAVEERERLPRGSTTAHVHISIDQHLDVRQNQRHEMRVFDSVAVRENVLLLFVHRKAGHKCSEKV